MHIKNPYGLHRFLHFFVLRLFERFYLGFSSSSSSYALAALDITIPAVNPAAAPKAAHTGPHTPPPTAAAAEDNSKAAVKSTAV